MIIAELTITHKSLRTLITTAIVNKGNEMSQQKQLKLFIVLIAFLSTSAFGSSQLGYGNTKCSIYNVAQKAGGELVSNIDSWALGYLSGLNHAAIINGKSDELKRQQPDRVVGYIQAHCESNPDVTVEQAASKYWSIAQGN